MYMVYEENTQGITDERHLKQIRENETYHVEINYALSLTYSIVLWTITCTKILPR